MDMQIGIKNPSPQRIGRSETGQQLLSKKSVKYFKSGTQYTGLPRWLRGKESSFQYRRCEFDSWLEKIPWRRKQQPTPVFLPGKSHGQRSLAGYSSWGHKRVSHNLATKQHNDAINWWI